MGKEVKIPRTKEECFAILDEMLSAEEKAQIAEMEDTIDLHFSLGLWIRNNWIYPQEGEAVEAFLKMFVDEEDKDYPHDLINIPIKEINRERKKKTIENKQF